MTETFKTLLTENGFSDEEASLCGQYADILLETNKTFNLTRITEETEVAFKHFIDSALPMQLGLIQKGDKVLDVGCGAGFPGAVLAIRGCDVTLLDAQLKKVRFAEETLKALQIRIKALQGRSEELSRRPEFSGKFPVVVSRAVAPLNILMELSFSFIEKGGRFLAYKGQGAQEEVQNAQAAAKKLGLTLVKIHDASYNDQHHVILEYVRDGKCENPLLYPRLYAKIKKNPL